MIHWHPDPTFLSIGPISIRWYGMMFLLGFTIGYFIVKDMCAREGKSFERLEGLLIYLVAGTTIGARLGHTLFYEPDYYLAHPIEILKIWEGGLASHGGAIGVIFAIWLFARRHPEFDLMWIWDRISVPTALVCSFIRFGNLMNSEILGKPSNVPWSFVFDRVDNVPRHPAQIYESLCYFTLFLFTYALYRRNPRKIAPGLLFGTTLLWLFTFRIPLELFKENQVAFEQNLPLNMGQLLSFPFIAIGLFFVIRAVRSTAKPAT